jgi:hypothetical protein
MQSYDNYKEAQIAISKAIEDSIKEWVRRGLRLSRICQIVPKDNINMQDYKTGDKLTITIRWGLKYLRRAPKDKASNLKLKEFYENGVINDI